jgi:excisionase family DNA binding protein
VAERLQVAATTVYWLWARRKLSHHLRVGVGRRTIRIPEEALDEFVSGAAVRPETEAAPPQPAR